MASTNLAAPWKTSLALTDLVAEPPRRARRRRSVSLTVLLDGRPRPCVPVPNFPSRPVPLFACAEVLEVLVVAVVEDLVCDLELERVLGRVLWLGLDAAGLA